MQAVTLDYEQRRLTLRCLAEPAELMADEVLIRVREVGVCGTDRDLSRFKFGRPPEGDSYLVLGHEAYGEVAAIGPGVIGIQPGDLVSPTVRRACPGPCDSCGGGRRDLCVTGGYTERGIMGLHGYLREYAVDKQEDVVLVPHGLADVAVLVEPLGVVEKTVELALAWHPAEPRTVLILGAGTIGLLCAMVFNARGIAVTLQSMEEPGSPRARLAQSAGARYTVKADGRFDIVVEAAGSVDAAGVGLAALAPLGVLVVLGAQRITGEFDFRQLILGNQTLVGSVNSSPAHTARAVDELASLDGQVLRAMIERVRFTEFEKAITGPPYERPKTVHVLYNN